MIIDIDKLLSLSAFGPETSEMGLILILEHEKLRKQSGERQLRLVAHWIDGDKDARLNRFEHLLQFVNLGTISYERYATFTVWNHAIINCEQSR